VPSDVGERHVDVNRPPSKELGMTTDSNRLSYQEISALLSTSGGPDSSIEAFQRKLRTDPEDAEHHYLLAIGLKLKQDTEGALSALRECVRLVGEDWPNREMERGVRDLMRELGGVRGESVAV
jgi:thioredoxin-like negative regulator of GroEL